jgi:hypothetical protein
MINVLVLCIPLYLDLLEDGDLSPKNVVRYTLMYSFYMYWYVSMITSTMYGIILNKYRFCSFFSSHCFKCNLIR